MKKKEFISTRETRPIGVFSSSKWGFIFMNFHCATTCVCVFEFFGLKRPTSKQNFNPIFITFSESHRSKHDCRYDFFSHTSEMIFYFIKKCWVTQHPKQFRRYIDWKTRFHVLMRILRIIDGDWCFGSKFGHCMVGRNNGWT